MDQEKIFKLLYEMVENEIIRQEERLLTEVEEEDIAVDIGFLDKILNQPPPPSEDTIGATEDFIKLILNDKNSILNEPVGQVEKILKGEHEKYDSNAYDEDISIIRVFFKNAQNIERGVLEKLKKLPKIARDKIGLPAALEKFKDLDGGGVPDSIEKVNQTDPADGTDDKKPYQSSPEEEPDQKEDIKIVFSNKPEKRINLEYDPEKPFSMYTFEGDPRNDPDFFDKMVIPNTDAEEIKEFYEFYKNVLFLTSTKGEKDTKDYKRFISKLAEKIMIIDQRDLNKFEDLSSAEEQIPYLYSIFFAMASALRFSAESSLVKDVKEAWLKSAKHALKNFVGKFEEEKHGDLLRQAARRTESRIGKLVSDPEPKKKHAETLKLYKSFVEYLDVDNLSVSGDKPKDYTSRSITSPSLTSVSTEQKKGLKIAVNKIFGETNKPVDIKERVRMFTEFSEKYTKTDAAIESEGKSVTEFMSELLLLELFNEMVKSFEKEEGSTLFEYFLALLVGGEGIGAERGAVDFKTKDQKGSAKFLHRGAKEVRQAISGFKKGETVTYVVAQRSSPATTRSPTATQVTFVDIKMFDVTMTDKEFTQEKKREKLKNPVFTYKSFGNPNEEKEIKNYIFRKKADDKGFRLASDVFLDIAINDPKSFVGTIRLASLSDEEYKGLRDIVGGKLDKMEEKTEILKKEVYKKVIEIFDNMESAADTARAYVSSGKSGDGFAALDKLEYSKTGLKDLSKLDSGPENEYQSLDDSPV